MLDLKSLEHLIRVKSNRVKYITNTNGKSEVWKLFKYIHVDDAPSDYVICDICKKIYRYFVKQGPSHLKRHMQKCKTKWPDSYSFSFYNNALPESIKFKLQQELIKYVARDLCPSNTVEAETIEVSTQIKKKHTHEYLYSNFLVR